MRQRRAERLLLRAEAALDIGFLDEAKTALAEAKRLSTALPAIRDIEDRLAQAEHPAPVVVTGSRTRHAIVAGAAAITVIAGIAFFAPHSTSRADSAGTVPAAPAGIAAAGPSVITTAESPAAAASPSIKIETRQVPPVVVSGLPQEDATDAPSQPAHNAAADEAPLHDDAPPIAAAPLADVAPMAMTTPPAIARVTLPVGTVAGIPSGPPARRAEITAPAPDNHLASAVAPETVAPKPNDAALVRSVLDKYADAYTHLDAAAAQAVWPSVNVTALSRAFNGLTVQQIAFADCSVDVRSTQARATCSGSATWQPKIGGGSRTDARQWAFDLQKAGDDWVIREARVQNR